MPELGSERSAQRAGRDYVAVAEATIRFDDVDDARREEQRPRRPLLPVVYAEDRATTRVHIRDECARQRGPTMAGD